MTLTDEGVHLSVFEPQLGREMAWSPDLLVLSKPIVPSEGAHDISTALKVAVDADGFFLEAHVKLRPVDFASEGLFMAGLAHYPKLLDETIVQAQAAAARAARVLSQPSLTAGGAVAEVSPEMCVGCLTCVRVCPFDVPRVSDQVDRRRRDSGRGLYRAERLPRLRQLCRRLPGQGHPAGAFRRRSDDGQAGRPDGGGRPCTTFEPEIVAFCCTHCAYTAADLAGSLRLQYPPAIKVD